MKFFSGMTARDAGLVSCYICSTLSELPKSDINDSHIGTNIELVCPCCKSALSSRDTNSLSKTWAFLIAAIVLYIPANTLPIMHISFWGDGKPETILSGVMELLDSGLWPLALLIFVASIVIPILKLIILIFLLVSIQMKSRWNPKDRTVLYRFTEFVGRWSMVDVFVIAILVTLVQFGSTASVTPDIGALSFAAVVILTMFAAHTFDPRLIWDSLPDDSKLEFAKITKDEE